MAQLFDWLYVGSRAQASVISPETSAVQGHFLDKAPECLVGERRYRSILLRQILFSYCTSETLR
jgi:hypothetical protein